MLYVILYEYKQLYATVGTFVLYNNVISCMHFWYCTIICNCGIIIIVNKYYYINRASGERIMKNAQ